MVAIDNICDSLGIKGRARDLSSLKAMLDEHPYSHVLRLAYLDLLKSSDPILFEEEVSRAAYHLPDRGVLQAMWASEGDESSAGLSAVEVQSIEEHRAATESTIPAESEDVKVPDGAAEALEEEQKSPQPEERAEPIAPALEQQYLTEAVHSSILLEVDSAQDEEQKEPETRIPEQTEAPRSFLDFISGESAVKESSDNDLIDQFLSGHASRPKKEFFSPEKMAKQSLEDKEGMVSDTLARIYINQGNYAKAIDAYERLILKYPEKSDYFAARIEKVKDLKRIKR